MIGDYICTDSIELEHTFSQLKFNNDKKWNIRNMKEGEKDEYKK